MASINKVILIGHLGQDPELRHTGSGTAVCNLSLATDESYTKDGGERVERTEWHRIVAWGRLAETCDQYLEKGRQVYVEGSLQTREWQDNDGNTRQTTEIKARTVQFLSGSGSGGQRRRSQRRSNQAPRSGEPDRFDSDDDLPF